MKKYRLLLAPLLIGALYSCYKPAETNEQNVTRYATLYFRDSATNAVLIGRNGQRFHPDSVSVFQVGYPANQPGNFARDADSAGKFAVRFAYYFDPVGSDDITSKAFDYSYAVRFNAADTDTVRFQKTSGSAIHFSWNGHPVTDIRPNTADTSINIRK